MKKDFIAISEYSAQEIQYLLDLAIFLKKELRSGGNRPLFRYKTLAMIFQKPSLRTRISFEIAMRHMGGDALYISPSEIGLGQRESIADVSRVLSGYVSAIMARVFDHTHIVELAQWSDIPVINGLSDYNHPCQGMADALTIIEKFGSMKGLNVSFIGDGNNVAVSLMHACAQLGANFTIAAPEGYDLRPEPVELAKQLCEKSNSGSQFQFLRDPHEAVKNAHVIYTDTWTSMGQEAEAKLREQIFTPYQVNARLVNEAIKM
jgi:ornithine carbamoyltransferase